MTQEAMFQTFGEMVRVLSLNAPQALVLDSWRRLERALDYYFIGLHGHKRPKNYVLALSNDKLLTAEVVQTIDQLRLLRNRIAHDPSTGFATDEAAAFAERAHEASWALGCAVPDEKAIASGACRVV
jgi:hypothetical protein